MEQPITLDSEIIEKNTDDLINYADMRKELSRLIASSTGNKQGLYDEMLQVLDLSAEWVNGGYNVSQEDLEGSVYFILS